MHVATEVDPLVSICIPVYNGQDYIDECLRAACNQTYRNLEVLVVDDCSTDESVSVVERWCSADSRVRLVRNRKNVGLVANWNRCVDLANGEWIKLLFQDDSIDESYVEVMLRHGRTGRPFLACDRRIVFENVSADSAASWIQAPYNIHLGELRLDLDLSTRDIAELALQYGKLNFIGEPTVVLVHRSVFDKVGKFNPDLRQLADLEYWLRAGLNLGICYVSDTLATFRVHPRSASSMNFESDNFDADVLDPLIIKHECLYSIFYASWRTEARSRGALRSIRFHFHYQVWRIHYAIVLEALSNPASPRARHYFDLWSNLAARYGGLENATHRAIRPLARAVLLWRHVRTSVSSVRNRSRKC